MNKEHILKKNMDFQSIIKKNRPFKYKYFVIYLEKNNNKDYKFGFSVGKKIGNAVVRNKLKRQLKHIISENNYHIGFNCIIMVGRDITNKTFSEMKTDLLSTMNKLKLIKGE